MNTEATATAERLRPGHRLAYCMSDGVIHVQAEMPEGGIEIARGPAHQLRARLAVVARHGYTPGVLLVPGVPEAENQRDGSIALTEWINWCANCEARDADSHLVWNVELKAAL